MLVLDSRDMMDRDSIITYLTELNYWLGKAGINIDMFVFGGAAMALYYDYNRVTREIDAVLSADIGEEIGKVSDVLGISPNWIYVDEGEGIDLRFIKCKDEGLHLANITVWYPSDKDMLCMKLISGRSRDVDDIIVLMKELRFSGELDLRRFVEGYKDVLDGEEIKETIIQEIIEGI